MREFIYYNGQILRADEAFLTAVSSAALYGRGIFTTVAVNNTQPFLWDRHWRRLQNNAEKLNIDLFGLTEKIVKNALFEIIAENKLENGRARLTFYDERASEIWKFENQGNTGLLITVADFRRSVKLISLTVSPYAVNSKSPLVNVKSCSYLENILAFEAAKKSGFDEAVRLNERGEIASACLANIFWLKNERLFTPSLETGCLAGTTREFLMEKFDCSEVDVGLANLREADAIFLTSAGIGAVQVDKFAGRLFERQYTEITKIF